MKLFITGNLGFIAGHLTEYLLEKYDYEIIGFDALTYAANRELDYELSNKYFDRLTCYCGPNYNINYAGELLKILAYHKPDIVLNFAAETHVDNSIQDSRQFLETNIMGVKNVLDACRVLKIPLIHMSCYDEKTKALTKEGLKHYWEIKEGEKVLTLNPETGFIEEKEIEKIIIQDYEGELIHFKTNKSDLLVTSNHRMFVTNEQSPSKIRIEEAKETRKFAHRYFPRGKWQGLNKATTSIKGIGEVDSEDLFYLCGIFLGDGFTAYQETKNKGYLCKSWRIFFDIPEQDKARKRLEDVLTRLKINWHSQKGKSGEHLYFTSEFWLKFFDETLGKGFKNKTIPDWMLNYDSIYLKALFDGLLDSDGSYTNGQLVLSTSSKKLRNTSIELGFKLGYFPRFSIRNTNNFYKKENRIIKPSCDNYLIFFRTQKIGLGTRTSKNLSYKGKIWCLKIKDNKNFIVERNGILQFCGNTDEVLDHSKKPQKDGANYFLEDDLKDNWGYNQKHWFYRLRENARLNPRNPYSASKAAGELLINAYRETHGVDARIVRSTNVYGPRQNKEKFLAKAISNTLDGKNIPVYGKGLQWRDWLYVADFCTAFDLILHRGKDAVYHVAANDERQNIEVAKLVGGNIEFVEDRPGHDYSYSLNCDKLKTLGWEKKYSFEEGLNETIEYYKQERQETESPPA